MASIDDLASLTRTGITRLEAAAEQAHSELWWIGNAARIDVIDHNGVTVGDITIHGEAYPGGSRTVTVTEAVQRGLLNGSPLRMEQQAERDRQLLDLLLAEPHAVDRDGWCDCDQLIDGPCTCGRDIRVAAYLAVLAEAYEETT